MANDIGKEFIENAGMMGIFRNTGGNPETSEEGFNNWMASREPRNVSLDEEIVKSEATLLETFISNFKGTYGQGPEQINPKGLLDAILMMMGDYVVPGGGEVPETLLIDKQNQRLDEWAKNYQSPMMPQKVPYAAPKAMPPRNSLINYLNK